MEFGEAIARDGAPVRERSVAFMLFETVCDMRFAEIFHQSVARYLGDDGSERYRGNSFVASDERLLPPSRRRLEPRIKKHFDVLRFGAEKRERLGRGLMRRIHDAYVVDGLRVDKSARVLEAPVRCDVFIQKVALLCGELF